MQCKKTLFALLFVLTLASNLNAQEASPEKTNESETVGAEDEAREDENAPVSVRVNEDGELVGRAQASVNGNWMPVEANVALVSNGVLLNKVVANQDGSFAFPNIAPGNYNVYGSASSFCGQQALTVLSECSCCDSVSLKLSQDSQIACYAELGSAPAATFTEGSSLGGGFASGGPNVSGGGAASGGGIASGSSRLRLVKVGAIATAIALGVSDGDEASPSN